MLPRTTALISDVTDIVEKSDKSGNRILLRLGRVAFLG